MDMCRFYIRCSLVVFLFAGLAGLPCEDAGLPCEDARTLSFLSTVGASASLR